MKNYIAPEMEIKCFEAVDIVTTSGILTVITDALDSFNADSAVKWSNERATFDEE